MYIFSGNSIKGKCGKKTNLKDRKGKNLFIGDIVALFYTDNLRQDKFEGLTVIVDDEYVSYSDGTIAILNDNPKAFVMGIKDCDIMSESCEWSVEKVKSCDSVVNLENWHKYGFNYKNDIK